MMSTIIFSLKDDLMKKVIALLMIVVVFSTTVFAAPLSQDQMAAEEVIAPQQKAAEPQNSPDTFVLPSMVMSYDIQRVDLLRQSSFFILDGRYLKYKEMEPLLLTTPGNEKYLHRAKGWEISTWVNVGIGVGAFVSMLVINLVPDIPNKELWNTATAATALVETIVGVYSYQARFDNMQRAIKNYNMSIMGVPVSVR
ncbi:MAG: hypothetical protein LBK43_06780 [Treponema sp.]|jgi:hypothetical protein|nr:hypothetical protein [Treponema sp.]